MRKIWRTKKRMYGKKNVLSANESLAGARSWIKTGIVWSIAQTNVAGLRSMRA